MVVNPCNALGAVCPRRTVTTRKDTLPDLTYAFHDVLLSSPVPLLIRLAVVPEGGQAARHTLAGALRAALTAPACPSGPGPPS